MKLLDETASDFGIMLLNVGHSWGEIQITRPQHCTVCEGKGRGLLFSCPESVVFGWRQNVDKKLIPKTECLKDTVSRVVPFWQNSIVPEIKVRRTMSMQYTRGRPLSPHIKSVRHSFLFSSPPVFPPLLPFPNHVAVARLYVVASSSKRKSHQLVVPSYRLSTVNVVSASTVQSFRHKLKSFLFDQSFPN